MGCDAGLEVDGWADGLDSVGGADGGVEDGVDGGVTGGVDGGGGVEDGDWQPAISMISREMAAGFRN